MPFFKMCLEGFPNDQASFTVTPNPIHHHCPPPPPPTHTHTLKMLCSAWLRGNECDSMRIFRAIRFRVSEYTRVRLGYDWKSRSENLEFCGRFGRHKVECSRVEESLVIIRSRVLEVFWSSPRGFGGKRSIKRSGGIIMRENLELCESSIESSQVNKCLMRALLRVQEV